jgi:hypothetical protein
MNKAPSVAMAAISQALKTRSQAVFVLPVTASVARQSMVLEVMDCFTSFAMMTTGVSYLTSS